MIPAILIRPMIFLASAILLSVGGAISGYTVGYKHGSAKVQADWDNAEAETAKALVKELDAARQAETKMQDTIDRLRTERTNETKNLVHQLDITLDQLRRRSERPHSLSTSVSKNTGLGENRDGCTGNELFRSDAEFLVREAERADHLRLALRQCENAYDSIRSQESTTVTTPN